MGEAICVGCGREAGEMVEYTEDDPVENDGTYEDGKFVCTECYCKLIDMRDGDIKPDIGTPKEVQERAMKLLRKRS